MSSDSPVGWRGFAARQQGLLVPLFIVSAVLILFAPLPPAVMDLLLACNVTLSVLVLLTTIYVARPLEFSVFPTILLGTTLARLVLNVASTRLILTGAKERGTGAAGGVIEAFGQFVSGDSLVVGLIIFVIIVVIQFVVITKGATRISEVSARFALDGMPGKQMAIDADLNAGLVTAEQAKQRRKEVAEQADFYGAMDGASKFVRGDAIAGIIVTLVNIAGGLYVGVVQLGMGFGEAAEVFTTLTIGDGLVSQVPAFLVSLAAALIVTRTSSSSNLSQDVMGQVLSHPEALLLSSGFLAVLSATGLPFLPLILLSGVCGFLGMQVLKKNTAQQARIEQRQEAEQDAPPPVKLEDELLVDPLELELGAGLVGLANPESGGDLLERVVRMRHMLAQELGILLPNVRMRDNVLLPPNSYVVKLRDVPVARGELHPGGLLAIDTGAADGHVPGLDTVDPAYQRAAKWIEPGYRDRAELLGYHVAEPPGVLVTHLLEVVRKHSAELLTRQQVHKLLDNLREVAPKLVEELVPTPLSTADLHTILRNLLKERVPIRDLEAILTTVGDYATRTKDLELLSEAGRLALARTICHKYRDPRDGVLRVVTLDGGVESLLAEGVKRSQSMRVDIAPQTAERVVQAVNDEVQVLARRGCFPVVVCSPGNRRGLKAMTETDIPALVVLSTNEIALDVDVEALGQVSLESFQRATAR